MRWLAGLLLLLLLGAGAVYFVSSRETAPVVTFQQPDRVVGQTGTLTVTAATPGAKFSALTVAVEQNGQTTPLFALGGKVEHETISGNTIRVSRPFGKQSVPAWPTTRSGCWKVTTGAVSRLET